MKTEKIFINILQSISFKAFAVVSYILLFISQRIFILRADEIELSDITERFSISDIALGRLSKFFDYFGVEQPQQLTVFVVFSAALLILGIAVLALSLFAFRKLQVINFCISAAGTVISIAFSIIILILYAQINSSDTGNIIVLEPQYVLIWLPCLFFVIGSVFTYAYVKMPEYRIAEGRFFKTLLAALNPKSFAKTFGSRDNTEALFRAKVPLKKKKYASVSKPDSIKKAKRKKKKKQHSADSSTHNVPDKRLSSLELALSKRDHAEQIANMQADIENRKLSSKKKRTKKKYAAEHKNTKPAVKTELSALELAKLRAAHAEEVAAAKKKLK